MFSRYFYALDIDKAIEAVSASCHHCCALKAVPTHIHQQSTSEPPTHVGTSFAADVMRRHRQFVLVLRETVTSYTVTTLIDNERHDQLRDALLTLCVEIRSRGDGGVSIRIDPAPGLQALKQDATLKSHSITLEFGQQKNINKNAVAENAIKELGLE